MRYVQTVLCAALALGTVAPVGAMEFAQKPLSDGSAFLVATGAIQTGDDEKLHSFVTAMPKSLKLVGIVLNSRGGNLAEGLCLASTIHNSALTTAVASEGLCASACFLMFAAGKHRLASASARIGVHSASSLEGEDSFGAQASTTLMARTAAAYGVPASVIGRMVTTLPNDMAWLTAAEQQEMGIEIVPIAQAAYQPGSSLVPGGSAPTPTLAADTPTPAEPTPAFKEGRSDRVAYEQWFATLGGEILGGATWWATNRSHAARDHLGCVMPNSTSEFNTGCTQAQALLKRIDRRRVTEPDFKSGWNSL